MARLSTDCLISCCCVNDMPLIYSALQKNLDTAYGLVESSKTKDVQCSHDSDLVSDVQSIQVTCQFNVCLLVALGSDKGVDLLNFDSVEGLNGFLDLGLVGLLLYNENECVVVLNGLDGRLSAEGMVDDVEAVVGDLLHGSQDVLGYSLLSQSFGSSERCLGPDLAFTGLVRSCFDGGGGFLGSGL